ncbi:PREDICTED: uncharacterized protein LOC109477408 [Branchiostoma belcheri]|uniref:Uncharacterized protein LOC109477408 n=1 Tax=Branchiostoma belcheri TaxID=7741 RepID=A0A6P4YXY9_BRABE|nr:PREDICTED: uncharacterized protein LOC109477408 [Branchiostoma belcheri]
MPPPLVRSISNVKRQFSYRQPIKPFVSSTFVDFQEERDYLVKRIFPTLDAICRERGSNFTPIDLRWGINNNQANSGQVIKLCLDYINRCTPFFICLLGDRYGSHRPETADPLPKTLEDLPADASWMDKNFVVAAQGGHGWVLQEAHQTCSITELEIIQASSLNDNEHCYFYFRDSTKLEERLGDLPKDKQEEKLQEYAPESDYAEIRVRDLKERLINKGLPVRYFSTVEELGRMLLEDWTRVIDSLYPPVDDFLDVGGESFRQWAAHESFAETRRRIFVSTPELERLNSQLDEHALSGAAQPSADDFLTRTRCPDNSFRSRPSSAPGYQSILMLVGERGCGKTAMVANWVKNFTSSTADIVVVSHYVGASAESTDVGSFLRRCTQELRNEFAGAPSDMASTTQDLSDFHRTCEAFLAALTLGPSVLVLDGIDELNSTYGMTTQQVKEFTWLPFPLPPQCRIIVTTTRSDLTYKALVNRPDVTDLNVPLLADSPSKSTVMEEHLAEHCKCLDSGQLQRIVECKLSSRPLFLFVLAHELCVIGQQQGVDRQLEVYLEATSIRDLWVSIIQRWAKDYGWHSRKEQTIEKGSRGWVADALRLIAVSRNGLQESEILGALELLGYRDEYKVASFDWALFRSCAQDALFERPGGLLNFFHQDIREAVECSLLGTVTSAASKTSFSFPTMQEHVRNKYHAVLAEFFSRQPHSERRVDELPWHLEMSGEVGRLCKVLSEPGMFLAMWGDSRQSSTLRLDLVRYWKFLTQAGYDPGEVYGRMVRKITGDNESTAEGDGRLSRTVSVVISEPPVWQDPSDSDIDPRSLSPTGKLHSCLTTIKEGSDQASVSNASETQSQSSMGAVLSIATSFGSLAGGRSDDDGFDPTPEERAMDIESTFLTESRVAHLDMDEEREEIKEMSQYEVAALACHAGQFLNEIGKFETAQEMLHKAHDQLKNADSPSLAEQQLLCKVEENIGNLYLFQLKTQEAEEWYWKALGTINSIQEEDAEHMAKMIETKGRLLDQLGNMKTYAGCFAESDQLLQEARDHMESACSIPGLASVQHHIGVLKMRRRQYTMAEDCLREALTTRERWYGTFHPMVADVLNDLAGLLADRNNKKGFNRREAESLYRRALRIREQCLGSNHLLVATTLFHLGKLLKVDGAQHVKREAVKCLQQSLDVRTKLLGPEHPITRAVRNTLRDVESQISTGLYDFSTKKQPDARSRNRPYSSMSWHEQDIILFEQKQQGKKNRRQEQYGGSRRPSSIPSGVWRSQSVVSCPNGRDTAMSRATREIPRVHSAGSERHRADVPQQGFHREEAPWREFSESPPRETQWEETVGQEDFKGDPSLFREGSMSINYFNTKSSVSEFQSRMTVVSRNTNMSRLSRSSHVSHKSSCHIPSAHSVDESNVKSVHGPHSTLQTLLDEPPKPRENVKKSGVQHKSAWYHIPGRYSTNKEPLPRKRSQKRVKKLNRGTDTTLDQQLHPIDESPSSEGGSSAESEKWGSDGVEAAEAGIQDLQIIGEGKESHSEANMQSGPPNFADQYDKTTLEADNETVLTGDATTVETEKKGTTKTSRNLRIVEPERVTKEAIASRHYQFPAVH